jgi:hypothetical protein
MNQYHPNPLLNRFLGGIKDSHPEAFKKHMKRYALEAKTGQKAEVKTVQNPKITQRTVPVKSKILHKVELQKNNKDKPIIKKTSILESIKLKMEGSIFGKIQLQRLARKSDQKETEPSTKFQMATKPKKKKDIADKVERQRESRKPKKPLTGAEGKDPKTVRSKRTRGFK